MPVRATHLGSRFESLRFLGALRAARDLGLSADRANAIAREFDPRAPSDHLIDALAAALLADGLVRVPDAV